MQAVIKSRAAILDRVRKANAIAVPEARPEARLEEWRNLPRTYALRRSSNDEELLALFEKRIRHYQANVFYLDGKPIALRVAEMLSARNRKRLVVPLGLPAEYLPAEGFEFVRDDNLSYLDLDRSDGIVTGALMAVALSGSVVLDSPDQGRRAATLVPDYHLCILKREDIVEFLPEAMERLEPIQNRAITFFSGPSATVDIEMTVVRGVHGPRTLDVLVV